MELKANLAPWEREVPALENPLHGVDRSLFLSTNSMYGLLSRIHYMELKERSHVIGSTLRAGARIHYMELKVQENECKTV